MFGFLPVVMMLVEPIAQSTAADLRYSHFIYCGDGTDSEQVERIIRDLEGMVNLLISTCQQARILEHSSGGLP